MIDFFESIWWKIKHKYNRIRQWFVFSTNKHYLRFLKAAFFTVPFDFEDLWTVQRKQLEFMLSYMEKRLYTTDETYDEIIKYIKLAISLNEIASGERSLFHFNGDLEYKDVDNGLKQIITDKLDYRCDVYVNLNNISRYIQGEEKQKAYLLHKHEVYQLKAKVLYFKILTEHIEMWWD